MADSTHLDTLTDVSSDPLVRETPPWFDGAKLGVFVHWNAAAIPAYAPVLETRDLPDDEDWVKAWRRLPFAEMYQNTMAIPGSPTQRHHAERYGDLPYEAFVARFRDELIPRWDPEPWADLFARVGARYVVLTTKTEDGFLLWPSDTPHPTKPGWQSERDVVGELAAAVRARGLKMGTYYCGGLDWSFQGIPITSVESTREAMPQDAEYLAYADAHWRELIDRYEPAVLWNDYGYPDDADIATLFREYLSRVPDGVINNRFDGDPFGVSDEPSKVYSDFVTPEYTVDGSPELKWEACRGIGTSFGYNREESERSYMSAAKLIHAFVDIVARGGNMLINVGPMATGAIPWLQAQRLLELGWWLRVNGEAIYDTRPWQRAAGTTGEGIGVRYTASADAVHAIVLGAPKGAAIELDVRLADGAVASVHGIDAELPWSAVPTGTRIELPELPDGDQPAMSVRLAPAAAVTPFTET
jgi:alpha-L-fucosidase